MTQGNSTGSYRSTTENHMKAFDALPAAARKALREANFDWATQPFVTHWRRGHFKDGKAMADYIVQIDANKTKTDLRKVWGADYPGALPAPRRRGGRRS